MGELAAAVALGDALVEAAAELAHGLAQDSLIRTGLKVHVLLPFRVADDDDPSRATGEIIT
jgi:hypothetical protein